MKDSVSEAATLYVYYKVDAAQHTATAARVRRSACAAAPSF